jgi:hypothetical protein
MRIEVPSTPIGRFFHDFSSHPALTVEARLAYSTPMGPTWRQSTFFSIAMGRNCRQSALFSIPRGRKCHQV